MNDDQVRMLLVEVAATIAADVETRAEGVLAGLVFGLEASASAPELAALLRNALPTDPTPVRSTTSSAPRSATSSPVWRAARRDEQKTRPVADGEEATCYSCPQT